MRRRVLTAVFLPVVALFSQISAHAASPSSPTTLKASSSGYLHTSGAHILNSRNQIVHITGVNWFGLETCTFSPHGLDFRKWRSIMVQTKSLGFNTIRLPISEQLLVPGTMPTHINYALNPALSGLSGLQIMDKIVAAARTLGLKVILDQHREDCTAQSPLWYAQGYPESVWIANWVALAKRYRHNDAVIGADLHDEPFDPATWGDGNPATDWRLAAERAGNAILHVNSHWLILVEGIEHVKPTDRSWRGGNLKAARIAPVRLAVAHRLVYEAHDYGPEVYPQSWFNATNFPNNLLGFWNSNWGYLQIQGIAPVLLGEFGGRAVDSGKEGVWIHSLVAYLHAHGISYAFWCLNPDSIDTGGLLLDDWRTVDMAKLTLLRTYQAPMIGQPHKHKTKTAVARNAGELKDERNRA